MKRGTIIIEHEGEDYAGVRYNGEYYEIPKRDGEIVAQLLKVINRLITK